MGAGTAAGKPACKPEPERSKLGPERSRQASAPERNKSSGLERSRFPRSKPDDDDGTGLDAHTVRGGGDDGRMVRCSNRRRWRRSRHSRKMNQSQRRPEPARPARWAQRLRLGRRLPTKPMSGSQTQHSRSNLHMGIFRRGSLAMVAEPTLERIVPLTEPYHCFFGLVSSRSLPSREALGAEVLLVSFGRHSARLHNLTRPPPIPNFH